jgi:hypothetical protein
MCGDEQFVLADGQIALMVANLFKDQIQVLREKIRIPDSVVAAGAHMAVIDFASEIFGSFEAVDCLRELANDRERDLLAIAARVQTKR